MNVLLLVMVKWMKIIIIYRQRGHYLIRQLRDIIFLSRRDSSNMIMKQKIEENRIRLYLNKELRN